MSVYTMGGGGWGGWASLMKGLHLPKGHKAGLQRSLVGL